MPLCGEVRGQRLEELNCLFEILRIRDKQLKRTKSVLYSCNFLIDIEMYLKEGIKYTIWLLCTPYHCRFLRIIGQICLPNILVTSLQANCICIFEEILNFNSKEKCGCNLQLSKFFFLCIWQIAKTNSEDEDLLFFFIAVVAVVVVVNYNLLLMSIRLPWVKRYDSKKNHFEYNCLTWYCRIWLLDYSI